MKVASSAAQHAGRPATRFPQEVSGRLFCILMSGAIIIRSFRVIGATGAGSLFLCMASEYELVDVGECRDLAFACRTGPRSIEDARITHWQLPVVASARQHRGAATGQYPRRCRLANRCECGERVAEIRAAHLT